ncbi:hypothetical protein AJ79_08630 [Helicocarpus griseus UAMH5409]|uniref:Major facilitator superfamily (MFS) profile domain-containing protein n=1 Tax=Helicocarpus griseus UAMH5409 TaxID=1447875 RepID=A0A2B7WRN7_9EURO|nr:hypothetical protein AJ79_08630 [Helicocarpus griseus UAMH5409]
MSEKSPPSHASVDGEKRDVLQIVPGSDESVNRGDSEPSDRILSTKIDFRILPILGLLYLICFLDRTNIANARIAGLEEGLNMPSTGYNTCLWIFYIPFVVFEVPSNMVMSWRRVRPNLWLGSLTFALGVLAMCQGLTRSYGGLLAIRFLMGIVETALPAGCAFLIASYYRKKELSLRFAIYYSFGQAGACFSGLLAYAIMDMEGIGGYEGWRWIFILEGLLTIVFSIPVLLLVPNFPDRAKWLKPAEQAALVARLEADKGEAKKELSFSDWKQVAMDYRIWLLTTLFFCADMSAGSLSSFNPTILSQLGWTAKRAQVMTIPVWIIGIVGGIIAALGVGKYNNRTAYILPSILFSILGWVLNYLQIDPPAVRYFAQFCISLGTFVQMPLYSGLLMANIRGKAAVSFGSAVQFGIGNCANFVASNVFINTQKPRYPVGFGTGLGITCFSFPLMLVLVGLFWRHNREYDRKVAAAIAAARDGGQVETTWDDQVYYRYVM